MEDEKLFEETRAWINCHSGRVCYPLAPDQTDYNIEDIAHSLSMQCRWNGHTKVFYSVAQHSCYCHDFVSVKSARKEALMHDASEAYLTDVPRPIKGYLGHYNKLEALTDKKIREVFDITQTEETLRAVKEIDKLLLVREKELLIHAAPNKVWGFEDVDTSTIDVLLPLIDSWSPEKAKKEFLTRFEIYND
jgi:uncharacterized protein